MNRLGQSSLRAFMLVSGVMVSTPLLAQQLGRGDDPAVSVWRVVLALVLILMLGGAALYIGRGRMSGIKLWQAGAYRRLNVIETSRMTPSSWLCLASCDGKEYLFAITANSVTFVDHAVPAEPQA